MSGSSEQRNRRQAVRIQLHDTVIGIELTLISIIQGLALGVLAASAVQPLIGLQWEVWPYIATGLLTVLIFWSRSLVHTLSFIGWPLEFGHTFIYFAATLIEAVGLSQVSNPEHWFALNALYAAVVWGLYGYDLHLVRQREEDFDSPPERALLADIIHDQRVNIGFMMPAAVAFQAFAWWLVHEFPQTMLVQRWHLLLIALTLLFSINYLYGGMRILRRRQEWIVERNAHALAED
ncbi:MAG TPA: hypothetical protein VJ727_09280 [Rhodanobacteraceae bacterium]|nr:hypothetical protein [Rhodanobacteraceae bacterium]